MAIESDILVIGGGIAGLTAARTAAESGADVRLVSREESSLRQASGLLDVLGYVSGDEPVVDPFDAMSRLPPEHPYRVLGSDTVRDALAAFDGAVDGYGGGHTDVNALVPTHGGTIKPTARYPDSVAPGLASDARSTLLVGFERITDFDGPLAAAHLEAAGVPFDADGATIEFPGGFRDDAVLTRYARALDRDESIDDGSTVRDALVERIESVLDGQERVGVPAVLGRERPAVVRDEISDRLGVPVFEIPTGPPSLLGIRLAEGLEAALFESGASVETGVDVVDFDGADRIDHVVVDRNGTRTHYAASEYVLATGGLVGKGIQSDRRRVREPVFGCHVPHPEDRYDWFEDDAFGDHRFARFGVAVGNDLRPLDRGDDLEFGNLRAAGSVLGGYDFAAENSGAGVSITTGHAAGELAVEAVT